MTTELCEFEGQSTLAARMGQWPDALRQHARGCPACSEALRAAAFLGRIVSLGDRSDSLPEPTRIWLRARIEQEIEVELRASRSRLWSLGLAGFAAALSAWAVWRAGGDALTTLAGQLPRAGEALLPTAIGIAFVGAISWYAGWRPAQRRSGSANT